MKQEGLTRDYKASQERAAVLYRHKQPGVVIEFGRLASVPLTSTTFLKTLSSDATEQQATKRVTHLGGNVTALGFLN